MRFILFYFLCVIVMLLSCNNDESKIVNISTTNSNVSQYNPTIMVFPSDAMLKKLRCLKNVENQGVTSIERNYTKAFIQESELKFVIASIEEAFSNANYPLENLEQQLKQINNEKAMDDMEDNAADARTMLMNTARPDFIIEIDYEYRQDPNYRNPKKNLSYLLTAIDAYTNKTVASITSADVGGANTSSSLSALIKNDLTANIPSFQKQINQRFNDIINNGIEITLRIATDANTGFNLGDECLGTENYNDWVNSWLKNNTIKSAYKSVKNTNKEMKFTNVRIKTIAENGKKYTAYDFANDLKKDFTKSCGVAATNKTQGIADAYLVLTGLK